MDELKETFLHEHDDTEASTLARVEQHTTKGHVRVGLHRQDQEHLRLAWLHRHKRRRRRDGASMFVWPHTMIQPVKDDNLDWSKRTMSEPRPRHQKDKCSSRIRMAAEEVNSTYPAKGTQNFGKKTEAIKEPLEEGGASTPNKIGEPSHLLAIIAAKSSIVKRSAEKEEVTRLRQDDKSQSTPPTPNMVHSS